jgi:hypothetical protein
VRCPEFFFAELGRAVFGLNRGGIPESGGF